MRTPLTIEEIYAAEPPQIRIQCVVCKTRVSLTYPVCPKCCPEYYEPRVTPEPDP
jgi:hypothetical protein